MTSELFIYCILQKFLLIFQGSRKVLIWKEGRVIIKWAVLFSFNCFLKSAFHYFRDCGTATNGSLGTFLTENVSVGMTLHQDIMSFPGAFLFPTVVGYISESRIRITQSSFSRSYADQKY